MTNPTKRAISASIAGTLSFLLFTAVPVLPQTVADAARRERERKKTHQLHVYTNEDLAKASILVPEDEARAPHAGKGTSPTEAASDAPGAATDTASKVAANAAISPASAAVSISAKNRKEAAARVIAATPNVQAIDSFTGPVMVPELAAIRPSFPAETNGVSPLFTAKGQIALPEVNLPQTTPDAYPLFDVFGAPSNINFPGAAAGNVTSVRVASPEPAMAAPVVSGNGDLSIVIGPASQPLLTIPAEPAGRAAVKSRPTPAAIESEAPAMSPLALPVGIPPADATIKSPVAPAPKTDNPIQLPGRTFEGSTIIVQRGDSLWKLAERYLGNGERWRELAKINLQLANPNLIHPGDPIRLPSLPVPVAPRGDLDSIVVRRGDTLWHVAHEKLGQPYALNCIAKANQLASADVILVGQKLVLPEACAVSQ